MRILRVLSSFQLDCGCVGGVYELYSGEVVRVLDAQAARCRNAGHRNGARLWGDAPPPSDPTAGGDDGDTARR